MAMSASELPPLLPVPSAPVEQGHRDPALAGAVSDLYRACRLSPPAILVARCGDEFVQVLAMMTFRPALALGPLLFALSCPCLLLAMLTLAWIAGSQDRLGTGLGDVIFAAYLGIFAPVAAAFANRLPLRMPFRPGLVHSLLLYGVAAVASAAGVLMLGGSLFFVLFAALTATACAILLHFAGLLLWARWWRWRFGRRQRVAVPPWGDHAVHDVIGPRLSSAADHVNTSRTSGPGPQRARQRNETPAITASMQADAERLGRLLWHDNGPLLGPAARYAAARRACVASVDQVADLAELPAVLRAAAEIDARVDAASFFAKTAVLLPADSALTLAEAPGTEPASARRSCRSPYWEVLAAVNAGPVARRMIDLTPSQALAKRLLVRLILRLEDGARRQTAIRAMGEGAFIEAARLRPMQSDGFGDLYLIGPQQNPLAFVKVRDASPGPDGVHREHWLSVPPHVATAREAVAWTFGMSESAHSPAAQS
jgi:hypothetical protein